MVLESEFKHFYLGTTSLYQELDVLSRGHPTFLHRNVRHSLDTNQQELARLDTRLSTRSQSKAALSVDDLYAGAMNAREINKWYPRHDQIKALKAEPTINLLPREVRLRGTPNKAQATVKDAELEWLPTPGSQNLQCEIECLLMYKVLEKWIYKRHEARPAVLNCSSDADHSARISIEMNTPFFIPESALHDLRASANRENSDREQGQAGPVSSALGPLDMTKFGVRVKLYCPSSSTRRDLRRFLHDADSTGEMYPVHSTFYSLDRSQKDGRSAILSAGPTKSPYDLPGYEMRIEVAWTNPRPEISVLNTINQEKGLLQKAVSDVAVPVSEHASKTHEITYVFAGPNTETRTLVARDLSCPWCKTRLPQSSFERLHFHYLTSHDYFKFTVHESSEANGVIYKTLRICQNDRPRLRASNEVPDAREMHWISPDRPFDLQKYLAGEDSWNPEKNIAKKTRQKSPSRDNSALQALGPWGPKPPDAVEQVERRKRKKHAVPLIKDVELYRSLSKRKLTVGEVLYESDDETDDDSWAARKQRMRSPPLAGRSMGAFFDLYDDYIHREKFSSDIHLSDAIVRFCRKYRQKLKQPLMHHDFRLKLQQLILTGLISHRIQDYCEELLDKVPSPATQQAQLANGTGGTSGTNGTSTRNHYLIPEKVPGAHPLTGHPKFKPLNHLVLHPEVQSQLSLAVRDLAAMTKLTLDITRIVGGRTDEELARDEYPRWVAELTAADENNKTRARSGRVVTTAGTCICGRAAAQDRGTIMCAEATCKKAEFHLACVNLKSRNQDWKCKDCGNRSTEWV